MYVTKYQLMSNLPFNQFEGIDDVTFDYKHGHVMPNSVLM